MIAQGWIAAAIAAAGFAAGWSANGWRLGSDVTRCEAARDNLGAALDEQGRAVEALKAAGERARQETAAAVAAGRDALKRAQAKVAHRQSQPAPQSCDAAFDLLDAEK